MTWYVSGRDHGHGKKKPTTASGRKQEVNRSLPCQSPTLCFPNSPPCPPFVDFVAL